MRSRLSDGIVRPCMKMTALKSTVPEYPTFLEQYGSFTLSSGETVFCQAYCISFDEGVEKKEILNVTVTSTKHCNILIGGFQQYSTLFNTAQKSNYSTKRGPVFQMHICELSVNDSTCGPKRKFGKTCCVPVTVRKQLFLISMCHWLSYCQSQNYKT